MTMHPGDPFAELASRSSAPGEHVLRSLREDLNKDPRPKKPLSRGARAGLSAFALVLGLGLTSVNALFSSPRAFLLAAAALSLSAGGLILAGLIPGGRPGFGLAARRYLLAALTILGFTALALKAESLVSLGEFLDADSSKHAVTCATHSLISGVVGSSALLILWRRTDPFSPGLTGALLGLLGGALGTVSVGLLCASGEGLHLTLGHGASLLVLTLAGVYCGRKWLSP